MVFFQEFANILALTSKKLNISTTYRFKLPTCKTCLIWQCPHLKEDGLENMPLTKINHLLYKNHAMLQLA